MPQKFTCTRILRRIEKFRGRAVFDDQALVREIK